jgi:hypothetical protein
MTTKITCNLETGEVREIPLTAEELIELEERKANAQTIQPAPAPTKEELLAQVQALTTQINALA